MFFFFFGLGNRCHIFFYDETLAVGTEHCEKAVVKLGNANSFSIQIFPNSNPGHIYDARSIGHDGFGGFFSIGFFFF